MFTPSQNRRLAVLDHLIAGRLEPRKNVMATPSFLPGLDSYLDEYFSISKTNEEISNIFLRFGVSDEKKRKIFFELIWEHARFVESRYIPLSPYTDPEVLLFFIIGRKRHMSYSEMGRMIEKYYKEKYSAGMLMEVLWRHFEAYNYDKEVEFEL